MSRLRDIAARATGAFLGVVAVAWPGYLFAATAPAALAQGAPPGPPQPLEIHRTGTELVQLLVNLGIFWILVLGVAVTLWLRVREADRYYRLTRNNH